MNKQQCTVLLTGMILAENISMDDFPKSGQVYSEMDKKKIDQIIKESLDEFLSKSLHEIIERFPNENPSIFQIKAKGEEKADLDIKRIESQNKRLTELIQEYLTTVEEAKKKRKLSSDDKLKRLIPPLSEIQNIIFPNYLKYHQFVDDTYIDLERELDLKRLTPNLEKYTILGDGELQRLGILNTESKNIILNDHYDISYDGRISVSEIYDRELLPLNQDTLRSKDLLTQILVCYTIKRALNGDKEANQKLYDLYEYTAEGLAINTATKLKLNSKSDEMRQDVKYYLRLLIRGFRPEYILQELLSDKRDKIIDTLPKWIRKFYVYYLSEYIPSKIIEIQKESEEIDKVITFAYALSSGQISTAGLGKKYEALIEAIENARNSNVEEAVNLFNKKKEALGLALTILLNPYTPIHEGTLAKVTPRRVNRFNSYSYRPIQMGPRKNLTTWLFGISNQDPRANLYRLLRDKYLPVAKKRNKEKGFDFRKCFDEEYDEALDFKDRTKTLGQDQLINQMTAREMIKRVEKELVDLGASERNIEIYVRWKSGETQSKIAKEYRLSLRQIRRICQQIRHLIPKVRRRIYEE